MVKMILLKNKKTFSLIFKHTYVRYFPTLP